MLTFTKSEIKPLHAIFRYASTFMWYETSVGKLPSKCKLHWSHFWFGWHTERVKQTAQFCFKIVAQDCKPFCTLYEALQGGGRPCWLSQFKNVPHWCFIVLFCHLTLLSGFGEKGCCLSAFHSLCCRNFLRDVAYRNLPWQGLRYASDDT